MTYEQLATYLTLKKKAKLADTQLSIEETKQLMNLEKKFYRMSALELQSLLKQRH